MHEEGKIASLNRWADYIETQLRKTNNAVAFTNETAQVLANTPVVTSSVTDGLIHGDSVWDIDPAYVAYRDDFYWARSTSAGGLGELGWQLQGSSAAQYEQEAGPPPHIGQLGWANDAVSNDVAVLRPGLNTGSVSANQGLIFPETVGWKLVYVFQFSNYQTSSAVASSFSQKSFYLGLWDVASANFEGGNLARPIIFAGLRYDTDTTAPAISDSTFHFECVANTVGGSYTRNNTQGNVSNTGVTPTVNVWYRLEILCTTVGSLKFTLKGDDGSSATATLTLPQYTATDASSTGQILSSNGYAQLASGSSVNFPWGAGSSITLSNLVAGASGLAGTYTLANTGSLTTLVWLKAGMPTVVPTSTTYTVVGYATMLPFICFGNDTGATPTTNLTFWIDFFSYAWNPGVGGGSGAPSSNKSRYW